jgi:hypothetical protein
MKCRWLWLLVLLIGPPIGFADADYVMLQDSMPSVGGILQNQDYLLAFAAGVPTVAAAQNGSYLLMPAFPWARFTPNADSRGPAIRVLPAETRLCQNHPNPFNPMTRIPFAIAGARNAQVLTQLGIYDIRGRQVIELVHQRLHPGNYEVMWNGRNTVNQPVASGVYFCRLLAGDFLAVIRIIAIT